MKISSRFTQIQFARIIFTDQQSLEEIVAPGFAWTYFFKLEKETRIRTFLLSTY